MSPITKPIIISGSGPSGLLLAHGLKKHGIPFRVFERDAALNLRAQGYRFKLTGKAIDALISILSPEHFALLKNTCGDFAKMNSERLDALTAEPCQTGGRPPLRPQGRHEPISVDRKVFRSVLYLGLENDVSFNQEIIGYDLVEDGVQVNFADSSATTGSLLVGADGSWSRIRRQLVPDSVPLDSEGRLFYGKTPITPAFLEKFNAGAIKGMTGVRDDTKDLPITLLLEPMIFSNRDRVKEVELPPDYVYWVVCARKDRVDLSRLSKRPSSEECVALLIELTVHWHDSIKPLFEFQDAPQTSILAIPTTPLPLSEWKSSGRVTLVGDAAHCMPPTGGIGATTALRDVAGLLRALTSDGLSAESLEKYEMEMRGYAAEAVRLSHGGGVHFFGLRPMEELRPFEQ